MAEVVIGTETEGSNCWSYEIRVTDGGQPYEYRVTLIWSDYDLWSHGRVAPQHVVHAALQFLFKKTTASSVLPKFDCSRIRRCFPEVDSELPKMF